MWQLLQKNNKSPFRVIINPRSFSMDHGMIEVKAVEKNPQPQKVLWKSDDSRSIVLRFIDCLCGQRS